MTDCRAVCPHFHRAVELIGRRWTGAVVYVLLGGPARFSTLRSAIPEVGDRILAERLRELESEGVVVRTVVAASPVRVEYSLTGKGNALAEAIRTIAEWGRAYPGSTPDPG